MRTNKPSKYYSPALVVIPKSTTMPLKLVVFKFPYDFMIISGDIKSIFATVGSGQYAAKQKDIDDIMDVLSPWILPTHYAFGLPIRVEKYDGLPIALSNMQPPTYNCDPLTIDKQIDSLVKSHCGSLCWLLVGDYNHVPSDQDVQDVRDIIAPHIAKIATYLSGVIVTHGLVTFHCYCHK